jgi:hypothetical protein
MHVCYKLLLFPLSVAAPPPWILNKLGFSNKVITKWLQSDYKWNLKLQESLTKGKSILTH